MKEILLHSFFRIIGFLARGYIKKRQPYIIGVNGSVGKTSCRMIMHQITEKLLPSLHIVTSPKNFNGELGMSLSIFEITDYTPSILGMLHVLRVAGKKRRFGKKTPYDVIFLEYGIDHPGEMEFLLSICKPDCSVHTQIDAVHSMQFGSPDAIAQQEFLLQQHTRHVVCMNHDDPYLYHTKDRISADVISYSATGETDDTTIRIFPMQAPQDTSEDHIVKQQARVTYNGKKTITLGISLLGDYHLAYAAVGVCLADILSYHFFTQECVHDGDTIHASVHLQPGRWSVFAGIHDSIIIDSTYNAAPRSMHHIIENTVARRNAQHSDYKILFVLGDMRELGTEEQAAHERLAMFLRNQDATVFLVGNVMKTVVIPSIDHH